MQSRSLEAYLVRKNLQNVSLQCKFSDFFAKMFATFCEIQKLKGILKIKLLHPFYLKKENVNIIIISTKCQLQFIAGLDSNTPISMLGSMTLLFDKLFSFSSTKKIGNFWNLFFYLVLI
jgi:hypothetical protein